MLAYADQRHIEFERHQAERPGQQQSLDRENVEPYIPALLIAMAQAQDDGDAPITVSSIYA